MQINRIQPSFVSKSFNGKFPVQKIDANSLGLSNEKYKELLKILEEEYHITPYIQEKKSAPIQFLFKNIVSRGNNLNLKQKGQK